LTNTFPMRHARVNSGLPADIYKQCEPTLIDTLIVGADVSKKHTLNDTLNSNSSKYVNLLWTH
jgi:hypothetical protein